MQPTDATSIPQNGNGRLSVAFKKSADNVIRSALALSTNRATGSRIIRSAKAAKRMGCHNSHSASASPPGLRS